MLRILKKNICTKKDFLKKEDNRIMKFKKTHFLLIGIAIVLLIGIGSVCASENVTDDSGDTLADDGTDVVLSDTDGNVLDDTSEEKTNTTVETGETAYEYKQDANKTIPVEVKDNKSSKIDVDKNNLSVFNGNKSIAFEYNSSVITITEHLPCGHYNLTINYLGNMEYYNSTRIVSVKIFGNNTIETETSVVCDGKNIAIPVKIYDQADYIELVKDNFNLTLIYTNENGNISNLTINEFNIEDGKINFTSPVKLINASLIIDYANATEPKTVAIKISTEINATVVKEQFESEEIKNISIEIKDGQGNLINVNETDLEIFENGHPVVFTYNNTLITMGIISEGKHNLTIVYKGNETYNASNTTVVLNVYGKNRINVPTYVVSNNGETVEIPITIFNGLENITINKENLTLNLTYTNETGDVASAIIGTDKFNIDGDSLKIQNIGYPLNRASLSIDYVNSTGAKIVKINLLTTINATPAKPKYRENETNNITVEVFDNNGNPMTIGENDLRVFDNGKVIQIASINGSNITVNLEQGVHNLTITYKGDSTYNASSKTIEVKVYGDARINPDESVVLDGYQATIFVNLNDGADLINIEDKTKLKVTLFYTVGNNTFNRTVSGFTLIENKSISFNISEDFDSAYVNIVYDNTLTGNTTIKVNSIIAAPYSKDIGENQVKNFTIEIYGTNDHIINVTTDNIQVLNNGKELNITVNNSVVTINDPLKFGVYNLTIKYLGTETYLETTRTLWLNVCGINATSAINVNSTKKGEIKFSIVNGNETITVALDELNMTATYTVGNETKAIQVIPISLDNGTLIFTLENGNFTTAILTIDYKNGTALKNVTLTRIYNARIEIVNAVNEYRTGNFTFRLVDVDDGSNITGKTVSFSLSNSNNIIVNPLSATTDENGIASFKNNQYFQSWENNTITIGYLTVGDHLVQVSTSGSVKATILKTNVTITPANIKINIDPYKEYYGSEKKFKVGVTDANGEPLSGIILHLYLPQTSGKDYYIITNVNGSSEISVKGLVGGDYEVTVSNNDTKNINNISSKDTITILKVPVVNNAKDVSIYYNSGTTYSFKITKDGEALSGMYVLVRLYTTSSKYSEYLFLTNNAGEIAFTTNLDVGKHKVIISSADTRYDFNKITKTITVKKASAKITTKKVTAYYKGGKFLTVKVTNTKTKKPIFNAKVNIKIYVSKNRYYNYNGNTGLNGKLKVLLDTLKPGTYKVVISGADSKNFKADSVTTKIVIKKAPTKFIAKKLKAKKGAKKYFKVTAKNKKTKKVIPGIKLKVKVYTGKKFKTYKIKTNSKGLAKLSVKKLKVGKHKVIITSANKYCVAKAKKSSITIKK